MSDQKTYQPGWGKSNHHKHHHKFSDDRTKEQNRGMGGALRMRDKQAYYGLICILVVAAAIGLFMLVRVVVNEFKAMPNDDPLTELNVDVLRTNAVGEREAILVGDSLARQYNIDSLRRQVHIDTKPAYRPPRKSSEWYITIREWKSIFNNYRIWRRMSKEEVRRAEEQQAEKQPKE